MSFDKSFEHSEELFDAAINEFIEKGYEQASINNILKNAGMSKGQFYYHFKTKERLYLALIEILIAKKQAFLAKTMQPEDFQQDIFSIFKTQIRYGMMFAREYPAINRFAESFTREQGNPMYETALEIHNFQDNAGMNQLIDMAFARGDLRDDLPRPFVQKVIGYLFTHTAELIDIENFDDVETDINHLIAFMKSGLGKQE